MDFTVEPIALVMGKGWNEKCEVVGQDSFAVLSTIGSKIWDTGKWPTSLTSL